MVPKKANPPKNPTKESRAAERELADDEIDATIAHGFATDPEQRDTTEDQ